MCANCQQRSDCHKNVTSSSLVGMNIVGVSHTSQWHHHRLNCKTIVPINVISVTISVIIVTTAFDTLQWPSIGSLIIGTSF